MTFLMRWLLGIAFGICIASEAGIAVADCLCGTAADELTAERVGLEREWVIQLPFDAAGWRVTHVVDSKTKQLQTKRNKRVVGFVA